MLTLITAVSTYAESQPLQPTGLRVEYAQNPLGIDKPRPRLSWRSEAESRSASQSAYQIQVATNAQYLRTGQLNWDSGKVKSAESLFVPYAGPELASREQAVWRVRVWNEKGEVSRWSDISRWEMGLMTPVDWQAHWIRPDADDPTKERRPVILLRNEFRLQGDVRQARLYATARGIYAIEINGKPVGDQVLAPGWTSYHHRIQYQTYDVTELLAAGDNAIGAMLADGWWRGHLGWDGKRDIYGHDTALLVQLEVTYSDGSTVTFGTNDNWRSTAEGPWRMADLYDGEIYDARRVIEGWSQAGFADSNWEGVSLLTDSTAELVAPEAPPIRAIEELAPTAISRSPNGEILVDMGQNLVGWVRLRLAGPAGSEVVLRYAEVLDDQGNVYTENLRSADATDRYILAGGQEEYYEPRFTFHGFRYVSISGYAGTLEAKDITGIVVHSDMARTGHWSSSSPLLNQLYHNIVWGQKGNFLDVPTDCPQRDERLGWTGDAQVFAPTAAFNMDVAGFFAKWLADLALDQHDSGSVPHVIPDIFAGTNWAAGAAAWGDAATVVPWAIYQAYADKELLARQFDSMTAWVEYIAGQVDEDQIWRAGSHFGDWLAPQFDDHQRPYRAITGTDLIATAYYAHSLDLVSRTAGVLGKKRDARRYRRRFEQVSEAFRKEFMTQSGRLVYETQTAYVLALAFDLLPTEERTQAAARLAQDVKSRGNRLTTGFVGTPELTHVLADHGQLETAYALLNQTRYPSWLYPVTHGATTIWERWDAIRADGTFQSPEMTSFNHYAYGAIGEWMVNDVAGLNAAAPGYRRLLIAPRPGGGLSHAEATLTTPYGKALAAWSISGTTMTVHAVIPANTTAKVVLPLAGDAEVFESASPVGEAPGVERSRKGGEHLELNVGSGVYEFSYTSAPLALQAAAYKPLGRDTSMGTILKIPELRAMITQALGAEIDPGLEAQAATQTLGAVLDGGYFGPLGEAITAALPRINAERRAAILE